MTSQSAQFRDPTQDPKFINISPQWEDAVSEYDDQFEEDTPTLRIKVSVTENFRLFLNYATRRYFFETVKPKQVVGVRVNVMDRMIAVFPDKDGRVITGDDGGVTLPKKFVRLLHLNPGKTVYRGRANAVILEDGRRALAIKLPENI